MELKNESNELVAFPRQLVIAQMRHGFRFDRDRTAIGMIEQAEDIKQRAFAAARWADHRVHGAGLEIQRNAAQCVDARFIFAEIALNAVGN